MDILNFIQDVTKESNAFTHHPVKELSLEDRLLYLNGLALVMNADGQITDSEKEYLTILIKSFDLDQSLVNDLVAFAQSPDKDTALAFFRAFRRNPLAQLFLFDAYMMAMRDEDIHEKEQAVIDKIAEQLEVLNGTRRDVFDLFCHIKHKDWEESSLYFSSHLLNPEYFKHLLEYYEVDLDELLQRTSKFRESWLKEKLQDFLNLKWIPIEYGYRHRIEHPHGKAEITEEFVSPVITNEMLVPFLQSKLDRGEILFSNSKFYKVVDGGGEIRVVYLDIHGMDIGYDAVKRSISCQIEKGRLNAEVPGEILIDFWGLSIESIQSGVCDPGWMREIIFPASADGQNNVIGEIVAVSDVFYECVGHNNETTPHKRVDMTFAQVVQSGKFRLTRGKRACQPRSIDWEAE